jgi:putative hemolysin
MTWLLILLTIIILIFFNALYVAAEFGTVSARRSRLAHMADEGNRFARSLLPIAEDPRQLDTYIAACQIGITLSSLVLGFFGQARLAEVVAPLLVGMGQVSSATAESISTTVVLLFLTILQVILGELVPKNIGLQFPERLAILTVLPMRWSIAFFRPLIWIFNGSGQLILRLFRVSPVTEHAHVHSPEEILMLVEESTAGGLLHQEERWLLQNTLQMRQLNIRQVMISRTRMLTAPAEQTPAELLALLADSPYSRLPLYDGSIDNIVGIVHLKDLLDLHRQADSRTVPDVMRDVPYVLETMSVEEVFRLLQREHYHVAIVLDEFGGTAGMVTLEDLIEEIFGELQDEFDAETPLYQVGNQGRVLVRGDVLVDDLNQVLELSLADQPVDTVGGLILSAFGRVPRVGEEVELAGHTIRVEGMDGNGVASVSLKISRQQLQRLQERPL